MTSPQKNTGLSYEGTSTELSLQLTLLPLKNYSKQSFVTAKLTVVLKSVRVAVSTSFALTSVVPVGVLSALTLK